VQSALREQPSGTANCHTAATMAGLVDSIRTDVNARLNELRPLVQEAASLEAALSALNDSEATTAPDSGQRRSPGRRTASTGRSRAPRGQWRDMVIEHIRAHPGSTAGDVAKALGLNRNSVGTRLTQLAKAGQLSKGARGYSAP
jgi:hypothetical protein